MKIADLRCLRDLSPIETDLCIIGTGPAGISLASEFGGTDTRVLLVESGGFKDEAETQSLYDIESTGDPRTIDQALIRRRIFGGSSYVWSGRCTPFDAIDFESRSWVAHSGWPISRQDIDPFIVRAASYLGLAPYEYDEGLWARFGISSPRPDLDRSLFEPMFWQFSRSSRNPKVSADFARDRLDLKAENIDILLHANVTHINTSSDGAHYESVEASTLEGARILIRSKALVLCCGGVENARLLLASNRNMQNGLGNGNDLVGRFLMDHIDCPISAYDDRAAYRLRSRFGHYWIDEKDGRHVYEHGLALSREVQSRDEILNCHAFVLAREPELDSPWHLLARLKGARRSYPGMLSDCRKLFARSPEIAKGLARRYIGNRPQIERHRYNWVHLMLEQAPDPNSRITLSPDKRDALGMPISRLHWKVGELERRTAEKAASQVLKQIGYLGFQPQERIVVPEADVNWISRCAEKAHPTGTTRMADDPKKGVVNRNCQIHGVDGLYVSGSSVFPTAGAANPTLMIVAMALRLADHLKTARFNAAGQKASSPLTVRYSKPAAEAVVAHRRKIGFIGAGKRVTEIYLPILQKQSDRFSVAGITSGSLLGARRIESETGISAFRDADELATETNPDLLIVAVSDTAAESTVSKLIDLGVPVLCETPLSWSSMGVRALHEKSEKKGVPIGVAEQFPYLPLEQFKEKLLATGVLGEIYAALNNFHSYDYHGIAQLRRYLSGSPASLRSMLFTGSRDTRWRCATVRFTSGAMLSHSYGLSGSSLSPAKPSVQIFGTNGSMLDSEISFRADGSVKTVTAEREIASTGELIRIHADMSLQKVTWANPYLSRGFSEEQIAVAALIDGCFADGKFNPVYTAIDFLTDLELLQGMRYSERSNGRLIEFPLKQRIEKFRSILRV